jgi:hypothetical protein
LKNRTSTTPKFKSVSRQKDLKRRKKNAKAHLEAQKKADAHKVEVIYPLKKRRHEEHMEAVRLKREKKAS